MRKNKNLIPEKGQLNREQRTTTHFPRLFIFPPNFSQFFTRFYTFDSALPVSPGKGTVSDFAFLNTKEQPLIGKSTRHPIALFILYSQKYSHLFIYFVENFGPRMR